MVKRLLMLADDGVVCLVEAEWTMLGEEGDLY
jgi:hypothetical protein